jgi:hypothetical protein
MSIKDLTENIAEIYENFPNLNYWMVSTNWTSNVYDIFDFLKAIDNYSNCHTEFIL